MDAKLSAKLLQNIDYFYAKDSNSVLFRDPLLEDRFNKQLGEQTSLVRISVGMCVLSSLTPNHKYMTKYFPSPI